MSSDVAVIQLDGPNWRGEDVNVHDVVDKVEELRRTEQRAATRTSVATLVIVTRSADELQDAQGVIDHLGVRHPARIITLLAAADAGRRADRVDAEVTLHAGEAAGHRIWSDELRLEVNGGPARHLASLLRPLLLSDLPVVVWYVRGLPDSRDPLLKIASAVIVDTKTAADINEGEPAMHRAFEQVSSLSRKHTIIDLSWDRLRPWRRLLAGQFDGAAFRPFVHGIERIDITGKLGPRTLLGDWMASRLRLGRELFHLYDGRHVAMIVSARIGETTAEFTVERVGEERLVQASATVKGGPSHTELLGLPDDALPLSLAGALKRLERDRVYEQAIKLIGSWD